jgi:hypothetical protein
VPFAVAAMCALRFMRIAVPRKRSVEAIAASRCLPPERIGIKAPLSGFEDKRKFSMPQRVRLGVAVGMIVGERGDQPQ